MEDGKAAAAFAGRQEETAGLKSGTMGQRAVPPHQARRRPTLGMGGGGGFLAVLTVVLMTHVLGIVVDRVKPVLQAVQAVAVHDLQLTVEQGMHCPDAKR